MKNFLIPLLVCGVFGISNAFASGYEKAVPFSAEHGGYGNAATSSVKGAESVYFNPAGLAAGKGTEASLHFSPFFAKFEGPIHANDNNVASDRRFVPGFGAVASHKVNEKLGIGLGIYGVAGNKSDYGEVDTPSGVTPNSFDPEFKGDLQVIEIGLGAGYEVMPGLRLGATWRASIVTGNLSAGVQNSGASLVETKLEDLSDSDFAGFRFGAQYEPVGGCFGFGAAFRTAVSFKAEGKGGGRLESALAPGTVETLSSDSVSLSNTFPWQLALGGHWKASDQLTVFGEYSFHNYAVNSKLDGEGTLTSSVSNSTVPVGDIPQAWRNLHLIRIGAEYWGFGKWALRGGYVVGSTVQPKSDANALLEAPGTPHIFTLGTGTTFMEDKLELNIAADYAMVSGDVSTSEAHNETATNSSTIFRTLAGSYKTSAFTIHTSVKYHF